MTIEHMETSKLFPTNDFLIHHLILMHLDKHKLNPHK
jgi:hypothetical protein